MSARRPFKVSLYDPNQRGAVLSEVWYQTFGSALHAALSHREAGHVCGLLDRDAHLVYRIAPDTPHGRITELHQRALSEAEALEAARR